MSDTINNQSCVLCGGHRGNIILRRRDRWEHVSYRECLREVKSQINTLNYKLDQLAEAGLNLGTHLSRMTGRISTGSPCANCGHDEETHRPDGQCKGFTDELSSLDGPHPKQLPCVCSRFIEPDQEDDDELYGTQRNFE